MRIGGVDVSGPCEDVLVLPRPTGQDVVFKARAVTDMDFFEKLCPEPTPPIRLVKGGEEKQVDAPAYLESIKTRSEKRFNYICIKSLEPSEIEWSRVNLEKPETYQHWQQELTDAGLSTVEVSRVQNLVFSANSLDEGKLQAARDAFLRGQGEEQVRSSGQSTEPESTPSGVPAKDSE